MRRLAPMRGGRRRGGFILLPVVLLLSLVAAMAFLGHRETALASAMAGGTRDMDKARYAAEAGLQRVTAKMHEKGCGGTYPIILLSALQDNAFDGARYYAYAGTLSGSPTAAISTGTYGDTQITLTRSGMPMHQSSAVSTTLQPGAEGQDTYVDAASSASNASRTTLIGTAATSFPMLKFDLSAVPAGSHVTSATLSTYAEAGSAGGTIALHRVKRDWAGNASWATADGSTSWSTAGGDIDPTAVASAALGGAGTWSSWEVTGLVDRWLKGSAANQGVQLRPSAGTSVTLTSGDGANATQRPKLTLTFLPPCGWTPPSTTVTLNPVADADIDADVLIQLTNFGGEPDIYLSKSHEARSMLQFDVSGIAPGKTVQSATLRMYFASLYSGTKLSKNLSVSVFAVSSPWKELEVNWLFRQLSTLWLTLGGDYNATAVTTKTLPQNMTPGQWIEFDVTGKVQNWVDGSAANNGFVLRMTTSSSEQLIFNSREATGNRPELVVTYK